VNSGFVTSFVQGRSLRHGWSPSRQYSEIAYSSQVGDRFEVKVVSLASGEGRRISDVSESCESPSWAPSGRHLAFACQRGGRWQITLADREGRRRWTLDAGTGTNVQPDWGPGRGE